MIRIFAVTEDLDEAALVYEPAVSTARVFPLFESVLNAAFDFPQLA